MLVLVPNQPPPHHFFFHSVVYLFLIPASLHTHSLLQSFVLEGTDTRHSDTQSNTCAAETRSNPSCVTLSTAHIHTPERM